jgi:RimJ/RimL family protein N-acetyltransferase
VDLRDGDLELRRWRIDDAPAIVAACNDPEIQHWLPNVPSPYTEADALAFIAGEAPGLAAEELFAITENGQVVGSIGMEVNEMQKRAAIGYWCAPEARGRGLTTRALRLLSRYALEELELQRVELVTDPENYASQRVAEKVGFQRVGRLRSHLVAREGGVRDSIIFSLLPGELA